VPKVEFRHRWKQPPDTKRVGAASVPDISKCWRRSSLHRSHFSASHLSTLSFGVRGARAAASTTAGRRRPPLRGAATGRAGHRCGARWPSPVAAAGRCCGPPPAAAGRRCGVLARGPPWWSARAARQQELEAARTRSAHRSIRRDPSTSRLVLALVLPLDRCIACKILLRPLLLVLGCESCSWFLSVQVARSTECPRRAQQRRARAHRRRG